MTDASGGGGTVEELLADDTEEDPVHSAPHAGGGSELIGRTVRLHFRCRAELPIGSFLRVTGSSLWAPGTPSTDPADASFSVERTEASAFPTTWDDILEHDTNSLHHHHSQSLYASSVEMVTTPEDYPIWRTRKPVVVVIPNRRKSVHHHYYRYLVVSPGGQWGLDNDANNNDTNNEPTTATDDTDAQVVVSTSDERLGTTAVLQWEDPFVLNRGSVNALSKHENSVASLASVTVPQTTKADYRNLPYRTIDMSVSSSSSLTTTISSSDSAALDSYSNPDDASFQPYLIREAVRSILSREKHSLPRAVMPFFQNVSLFPPFLCCCCFYYFCGFYCVSATLRFIKKIAASS